MTQLMHALDEVEPESEEVPLMQLEQVETPEADVNVPSAQAVQAEAPAVA